MKTNYFSNGRQWLMAAALAFGPTTVSQSQDVTMLIVAKGQNFEQIGPTNVVLQTDDPAYGFHASVSPWSSGAVTNVTLRAPNGVVHALANQTDQFGLDSEFATKPALDSAFGSGSYMFTIGAVNDGIVRPTLALPSENSSSYPNTPRITNWEAAQEVDAAADFTLAWTAFAGGTTNDFVQVMIEPEWDGSDAFSTGEPGTTNALNGTSTFVVIPAHTLNPGQVYYVSLLFAHIVTMNETAYPGATGIAAYFKSTESSLVAANPFGTLKFSSANHVADETAGTATITVIRTGGSEGSVSVDFATGYGNADEGMDYLATNGTLTFGPGITSLTFSVPVLNDIAPEGPESLQLVLLNEQGGAGIGTPDVTTLVILDDDAPPGPDIETYVIAKGQRYLQSGPATPTLITNEEPYSFDAFVDLAYPGAVTNASLRFPNGSSTNLEHDGGQLQFHHGFTNKSGLDAAFGAGTYRFTLGALRDGLRQPSLVLPSDTYPNTPQLSNWVAAQQVDASADLVLSWSPFSGGTTNDFVQLTIRDEWDDEVFSTQEPGDSDGLNGKSTSLVITNGTLNGGETYRASLLFARVLNVNTTGYPGAIGFAAYYRETSFEIKTLNPYGVLQFSLANDSANESSGTATVTVTRIEGSQGTVSVLLDTANGTALGGEDFAPTNGVLTFGPDIFQQSFTVSLLNDTNLEGPETFSLVLHDPDVGATLGSPSQAMLLLLDDDIPPGPDVESYLVAKGQQFQQTNAGPPVVETADGPFYFVSFVDLAYPGAVTNASLLLPNRTVKILSEHDGQFELEQSFTNKSRLDAAFAAGTYTFTMKTFLNGTKTPALSLPSDAYPPAPHLANWLDAQGVDAAAPFTVNWDPFTNGTPSDYVLLQIEDDQGHGAFSTPGFLEPDTLNGTNTFITIPAGTLQATQTYQGRLMFVKMANRNTNSYPGVLGIAGYFKETKFSLQTLAEASDEGRLQFTARNFSANEDAGLVTVSLLRAGGSSGAVSVEVATSDGTARSGADYAGGVYPVTLGDGVTSTTLSIPLSDDYLLEGNETFSVTLRNPGGGATLGTVSQATVTLLDNERQTNGVLQFAAATFSVTEAGPAAQLRVSRIGGSAGTTAVHFATMDLSATGGADYATTNGVLTFRPGEVSKTLPIRIREDSLDETNETFRVVLSTPIGGAALGSNHTATVTITDNDIAGVLNFKAASYSVSETGRWMEVTVTRAGGSASNVTVNFTTLDSPTNPATAGLDYVATNGTLSFGASQMSQKFQVFINDDPDPEGNETLLLQLSEPTGRATLGGVSATRLNILDNEVTLQFSRWFYTNSEAGPSASITVERSGPVNVPVGIRFETADGTATAGVDYKPVVITNLTLASGAASRGVTIPLINDGSVEEDETVLLQLSNPTGGALLGPRSTATLVITNNDFGGTISLSATNYTVTEAGRFAAITLSRAGGLASNVTVRFTLEGGTATAGLDYTNVSGTVRFNANETTKTLQVPIINDTLDEPNETVFLSLSDPTEGARLGARTNAVLSITDDDLGGALNFSAASYSISETGQVIEITVNRAGGSAGGVTVGYATHEVEEGAYPGEDYASTSGTLNFAAGQVSQKFQVFIYDDVEAEGPERLSLLLSNPTGGAKLGSTTSATLTIMDNEVLVQGLYKISGSTTVSGCTNDENGSLNLTGELNMDEQEGTNYWGYGSVIDTTYGGYYDFSVEGSVDSAGKLAGIYSSYDQTGTFTGTVTGNRLQMSLVGSVPEDTCRFSTSLSGTLYAPATNGFAPGYLGDTSTRIDVLSGSGVFPASGSYQINFLSDGGFEFFPLPAMTPVTDGLSLYTKTGANTGTILMYELNGYITYSTALNFTSPTNGTFSNRSIGLPGTQSGRFTVLP